MKKLIATLLTLTTLMLSLTALAQTADTTAAPEGGSKVLVAVFSRAGENYGVGTPDPSSPSASYAGYIEKGNTQLMAEMIAQITGGDLFAIAPVTPYPEDYASTLTVARAEAAADARPELAAQVENMAQYDVVLVGYPIWDGDMPQVLYTFLESYDFTGKTVIPFNTHAGSGQSGTVSTIREKLPTATVLDGMALSGETVQNQQDAARETVTDWLATLELTNKTEDAMTAEQEILADLRAYYDAMEAADIETMSKYIADDATFTHMSGLTQTKAEYLADIESGALDYIKITMEDVAITVDGDHAAVSRTNVMEANAYGAYGTYRMGGTAHLVKRDGLWVLAGKPEE